MRRGNVAPVVCRLRLSWHLTQRQEGERLASLSLSPSPLICIAKYPPSCCASVTKRPSLRLLQAPSLKVERLWPSGFL